MHDATAQPIEVRLTRGDNLVTLQSHILAEETKHPGASGTFSWILSALSISAKMISARMRRARLVDVLGALDSENVQGETQQKLDVIANEILLRNLGAREGVAIVASEESEQPVFLRTQDTGERRYVVLFDPLDGSSNLDVAGGVGTIFSILRHDRRVEDPTDSVLQAGTEQVAAGYVLYGSSTVFVLTTGNGVRMFVLDPTIGAFLLVEDDVRIPRAAKTYSLNEGHRKSFPAGYQRYLDWAQSNGYSSRYAGAMVADVHRTLLKGGVFLYPPTAKAPEGKLRLLYEANPMALIVEQAGGRACAGRGRLLEVRPTDVHQRTPVVLGSADEVGHVLAHLD
ncbi:MAG TPA: class 1 fructose-bisphosphatase [Planctomycetota bacterium]|nr:class 1 fructose-bisphosphatase [Planctomycetota bacterium]